MTRFLKVTSLFLAVLAIGAIGASAAQAEGLFEAEEYPAVIEGEQTETFVFQIVGGGSIKCEVASFLGELTGSASTIPLAPTFKSCKVSGLAATILVNGCEFIVNGGEEVAEEEFEAPAEIACPGEARLEVHLPLTNCVLAIDGQVGLGDLFIKPKIWIPPDLIIGVKVGEVVGAIEKTEGKACGLGVGMVKLDVNGGITLRAAKAFLGPYFGLSLG